jgi:DNA-binding MarR family transcriptional regulator
MSQPEKLSNALANWVDLFMSSSVQDLMQLLKDNNLSISHYMIFMHLQKLGPCAVSEIASLLKISNPSASQMVERLVKAGLLTRAENSYDRRVTNVCLTPTGENMAKKCIAARARCLERLPELNEQQQDGLCDGLEALTDASKKVHV